MISRFEIRQYAYTGLSGSSAWSITPTILSDCYDVNVRVAVGDAKDVFSFKRNNERNSTIGTIEAQDRIEIYYLLNNATADTVNGSNLVINGVVKKVEEVVNDKGKILNIDGTSFSEIITTGLVFFDSGSSHTLDVMEFIQGCLNSIRNFDNTFSISWDGSNPTVKVSDGTAYSILNSGNQERAYYLSFNKVLEKYLQSTYTEDGRYYYFIRNTTPSTAVLSIRKRTNDIVGAITEGTHFYNSKFGLDATDVKNFIIVKCGYDPASKPITTRYDNVSSRAQNGFRYYMLVDHNIAGNLLAQELSKFRTLGIFQESSNFPTSFAGYTTTWGLSASSNNDWTSKFIARAKTLGEAKGRDFSALYENGLLTLTADFRPTMNYVLGSKYSITAPSYAITDKLMRITDISYDINSVTVTFNEEVLT